MEELVAPGSSSHLAVACLQGCPPPLLPQVRGWTGFGKSELWYMVLSLTSKQLLAWITYGGTKRFEGEGQQI